MKRFLNKRVIGYFLWAVVFAAVLIIWRFPYQSLVDRLETVASSQTGLNFALTDVSFSLPSGLKVGRCMVRSGDGGEPFFEATQVRTRLKVIPLLKGSLAFTVQGRAYDGSVHGSFFLTPLHDFQRYRLRVAGQTIRLKGQPVISEVVGRPLTGVVSGEIELKGEFADVLSSSGGGTFQLVDGSCSIDSPFLREHTLKGLEVTASIALSGGNLHIKNGQFKGQGLEGTVSGEVKLQPGLSTSILNLAGLGQVDPNLLNIPAEKRRVAEAFLNQGRPLPFKVRGTIAEPRLTIF
jgi:type II secretion system protein N